MIGGNVTAEMKISSTTINAIGEAEKAWNHADTIKGWLDLQSGNAGYSNFNAKIQESTHIFVADYKSLNPSITNENARLIVSGKQYDILLIDNPMEMNSQLEIYLKYVGGV